MVVLLICSVVGVVLVNGWSDAPTALTTVVCTKAMAYKQALARGAVCNAVGAVVGSLIFAGVSDKVLELSPKNSPLLLCWVLLVVIIWSAAALHTGIPTSESHALLSALCGATFGGGQGGIDINLWVGVATGLLLSAAAGWGLGNLTTRFFAKPLQRWKPHRLRWHVVANMDFLSLLHGAQDGQKFVAMLLAVGLGERIGGRVLSVALCAVALCLGSLMGGGKIIDKVGRRMAPLDIKQGLCSDWATAITLFICTAMGLPISTGTVRVCAMAGAGQRSGNLRAGVFIKMWGVWLITFPVCFGLGWLGGIIFL